VTPQARAIAFAAVVLTLTLTGCFGPACNTKMDFDFLRFELTDDLESAASSIHVTCLNDDATCADWNLDLPHVLDVNQPEVKGTTPLTSAHILVADSAGAVIHEQNLTIEAAEHPVRQCRESVVTTAVVGPASSRQ
jgi:hypothetical protein